MQRLECAHQLAADGDDHAERWLLRPGQQLRERAEAWLEPRHDVTEPRYLIAHHEIDRPDEGRMRPFPLGQPGYRPAQIGGLIGAVPLDDAGGTAHRCLVDHPLAAFTEAPANRHERTGPGHAELTALQG